MKVDRRALLTGAMGFSVASLIGTSRRSIAAPGWDEIYFDSNGLIVQRNVNGGSGDGGDTAQREGWAWFGKYVREYKLPVANPWPISLPVDLQQTLTLLEKDTTGKFRRHPTQPQHSDPAGFSRDQLTPLLAAMSVWGDTARLTRSRNALSYCSFPPPSNAFRIRGISPVAISSISIIAAWGRRSIRPRTPTTSIISTGIHCCSAA